jgi:hypothetical protein
MIPTFLIFFTFISLGVMFPALPEQCRYISADYKQVSEPSGTPWENRYNLRQVKLHVSKFQLKNLQQNDKQQFACIDGRKTEGIFGTLGGDFGEFILGVQSYLNLSVKKKNFSKDEILNLLKSFIDYLATEKRRFYYHTSKEKANVLFAKVIPKVVILPDERPLNVTSWFAELPKPEHQGCGHIKILLTFPEEMGITDQKMVHFSLQSMLEIYWTPGYNEKIDLDVLQGELRPNAVVSIKNSGCQHHNPVVIPNRVGSSVFIHHSTAIENFRETKIAKFFTTLDESIEVSKMVEEMNRLGKIQMQTVLNRLTSAKVVNTYEVDLKTESFYEFPISYVWDILVGSLTFFTLSGAFLGFIALLSVGCFCFGSIKKVIKRRRVDQNLYTEL